MAGLFNTPRKVNFSIKSSINKALHNETHLPTYLLRCLYICHYILIFSLFIPFNKTRSVNGGKCQNEYSSLTLQQYMIFTTTRNRFGSENIRLIYIHGSEFLCFYRIRFTLRADATDAIPCPRPTERSRCMPRPILTPSEFS